MANQPNVGGEVEINFIKGRMNKDFDRRVIPDGEYIDAMNIRIGSTENDTIGAIQNTKGNIKLTELQYNGSTLVDAICIGALEDGSNETLYWFVTAPGVVDMIVSYNTNSNILRYHSTSDDGILNFNTKYLINSINKIDDLLFWTDGLNPPRKINVTRSYVNPKAEDLNVIVAPPVSSPDILLVNQAGEENFMIERFISFSYRYKYKDNEYSALSQFSEIAFEPGKFSIDYSVFENKGMQNIFNSVEVSFNTGGENVVGIDICFKESDSNIINVIEKYNKKDNGWLDNVTQSLLFSNKKIYTTLLESELLRTYDNVPLIARAQTMMGNRIMYGNYVDGYDLVKADGNSINLDYSLEVISEDIGYKAIPVTYDAGVDYTIDPTDTVTVSASEINIDLTGIPLLNETYISISFNLVHSSFGGDPSYNSPDTGFAPQNAYAFSLIFNLQRDYTSVYDLATSQEFLDAISTHRPYDLCSEGISITDLFNCSIVGKLDWTEVGSGIINPTGQFQISSTLGSDILKIQVPAVQYTKEDPDNPGTYLLAYEYFYNALTDSAYSAVGSKRSLHSNRDYEVGIVYMDDYNRSSTALVNTSNTVFVPSSGSDLKNTIRVTLNSLPPYWATKYKFVVKPSKSKYETIYTNIFFIEDNGYTWFKLDGDNRSKVQENSKLVVKRDSTGALNTLVTTKVLGLESKIEDFITGNKDASGKDIIEPSGMYMKLKPSGFSAIYQPNSFIDNGMVVGAGTQSTYLIPGFGFIPLSVPRTYPQIGYLCSMPNPDYISPTETPSILPFIPYDIPAGSSIRIYIHIYRFGRGAACGSSDYEIQRSFVASQDYVDMHDFMVRQNIDLEAGKYTGGESPNENVFDPTLAPFTGYLDITPGVNKYQFQYDDTTGRLVLFIAGGTKNCSGVGTRYARVACQIQVQRAASLMVFETEALDADGEIYYEGSDSFDIINGYHMSGTTINDIDQTSSNPAIVDLNFFNCFSFGNGVESYKVNDSLIGAPFYLGTRVTAVSQEDFKQADRYAGITYSGVYNSETNINKLNEFNLALANWKDCEKSFGPINKMHGRKTDILTLQEDKISYVLAGKNLLSDAAGGGAITSIPEVLGTQISRIEEFGISSNPESFSVYGQDVYFTDTKRTAVINLKGGSAQSDELVPISMLGMHGWFRAEFKDTLNYQKLGGYDPYLSEYVLSLNENKLPTPIETYDCGITISQNVFVGNYEFSLRLGDTIGDVSFDCNVTEGSVNVQIIYDGSEVINETITGSLTFSFAKESILPKIASVIITCDVESSYALITHCPVSPEITVVRVVANSPGSVDKTIHNNYNWTLGSFTSVTNIDSILLEADGVSLYDADTAMSSVGVIPAIGSTVYIDSVKLGTDTFTFYNDVNSFKYLVSDTLYTELDIPALLLAASTATPIINPMSGKYSSTFVYDNPMASQYLYLIWDYRIADYSLLDYSSIDYSTTT